MVRRYQHINWELAKSTDTLNENPCGVPDPTSLMKKLVLMRRFDSHSQVVIWWELCTLSGESSYLRPMTHGLGTSVDPVISSIWSGDFSDEGSMKVFGQRSTPRNLVWVTTGIATFIHWECQRCESSSHLCEVHADFFSERSWMRGHLPI